MKRTGREGVSAEVYGSNNPKAEFVPRVGPFKPRSSKKPTNR